MTTLQLAPHVHQVNAGYGRVLTCGHSVRADIAFFWNLKTDDTYCLGCALEQGIARAVTA